jgi:hypothetical protein
MHSSHKLLSYTLSYTPLLHLYSTLLSYSADFSLFKNNAVQTGESRDLENRKQLAMDAVAMVLVVSNSEPTATEFEWEGTSEFPPFAVTLQPSSMNTFTITEETRLAAAYASTMQGLIDEDGDGGGRAVTEEKKMKDYLFASDDDVCKAKYETLKSAPHTILITDEEGVPWVSLGMAFMAAGALVVMVRRQLLIEKQLVVVVNPASPASAECGRSPTASFDAGATYDSTTAGIGAPAMELEEL